MRAKPTMPAMMGPAIQARLSDNGGGADDGGGGGDVHTAVLLLLLAICGHQLGGFAIDQSRYTRARIESPEIKGGHAAEIASAGMGGPHLKSCIFIAYNVFANAISMCLACRNAQ